MITARAVALGAAIFAGSGCVTQLNMAELSEPEKPHATILFSSVSEETRRFPDYSGIDRSILTDASSTENPDTESP